MIGETVRSEQAITGSAHFLGRKIISTGEIGGDAYLAGMDLSVDGKIAGDATLAGYNVQVDDVDGDLRMSGANLVVSGTVSGYALIAGDDVRIESVIKGDVSLTAREVEFADGARIEGSLTIYEEQAGKVQVPSGVISPGQVERRDISEWSESATELKVWDWPRALRRFLTGVMAITIIAAVIAALVPNKLAELRRSILEQPFRNLLFGFLVMSAVIGSTIVLMMTVVGLLLAPATVFVALTAGFAGYVVGSYAIGVGLLLAIGQHEPDSFVPRALAAGTGAFVVAIIALIPFLGWLFVLALSLAGLGSIALWLFKPEFFVTA